MTSHKFCHLSESLRENEVKADLKHSACQKVCAADDPEAKSKEKRLNAGGYLKALLVPMWEVLSNGFTRAVLKMNLIECFVLEMRLSCIFVAA